ncbi:MAG: hypothetical protein FK734_21770 [Asgard group archaeon]|nr:hypothetical protein [Asgard group archaeon]
MVKELVFHLNNKTNLESLIDKLEERVVLQKADLDTELGFGLLTGDRALNVRIIPKSGNDDFHVIAQVKKDEYEVIVKNVFGNPIREIIKDASILDIAEFIADLPEDIPNNEIKNLIKEKFKINDLKYSHFKKIIIKQAARSDSKPHYKQAAERLL